MGPLLNSFFRQQANTLLGVWSPTSTDRSLFEVPFPQRFMKLPEVWRQEKPADPVLCFETGF